MKILNRNLDDVCPVYRKYSMQTSPQPAYIELDCRGEGELSADYSGEIGNAVPFYVWLGLAQRFPIPPETTGESIEAIFNNPDFVELCEDVITGFEEKWDGSNFVGRYTDEAREALDQIEDLLERSVECAGVWDVNDWLFGEGSLSTHWEAGQSLAEAVAKCEGYVEANTMIDGDFEEALLEKAKELFEYHPELLSQNHVEELLKQKQISEEDRNEWSAVNVLDS